MEKVMDAESRMLVEAIRVWAGWGNPAPKRDDARLAKQFGSTKAQALLPVILRLERDFYLTKACDSARDLAEMAVLAKKDFDRIHPEIASEVGDVLAWCYTFDLK